MRVHKISLFYQALSWKRTFRREANPVPKSQYDFYRRLAYDFA